MGLVRQTSALALVVTLSLLGIPLPAHAGEESPPLTLSGHALSQLLNSAVPGDPFRLAGLLEQETGRVSGGWHSERRYRHPRPQHRDIGLE